MAKDQVIGSLILVGAILVLGFYIWLIYAGLSWWAFFIVSTVAVFGVMGIIAWIGWTMATTPPPVPIESFEESISETSSSEEEQEEGSST
ncbi:MAG: phage holin family protein [Candidatus Bathyarchaeota archaeon]|nr:MAG: phage holin family protein [Candidatus Bathyarchaeota archaeon]